MNSRYALSYEISQFCQNKLRKSSSAAEELTEGFGVGAKIETSYVLVLPPGPPECCKLHWVPTKIVSGAKEDLTTSPLHYPLILCVGSREMVNEPLGWFYTHRGPLTLIQSSSSLLCSQSSCTIWETLSLLVAECLVRMSAEWMS